jgi:hypothetical protein
VLETLIFFSTPFAIISSALRMARTTESSATTAPAVPPVDPADALPQHSEDDAHG